MALVFVGINILQYSIRSIADNLNMFKGIKLVTLTAPYQTLLS